MAAPWKPASGGPALTRRALSDALLVAPPRPWLRPPMPRLFVAPRPGRLGAGRQQDQGGRTQQDDPQRREDAAHHREHHLQRRLSAKLLRALPALAPHLVRLDAEDLADAGAELLGLDDRLDEVVEVVHAAGAAHLVHRLEARAAEAHLAENL